MHTTLYACTVYAKMRNRAHVNIFDKYTVKYNVLKCNVNEETHQKNKKEAPFYSFVENLYKSMLRPSGWILSDLFYNRLFYH